MASKKASALSPVSVVIASASAGEVSGPVATMTLSQSAGGRPATSSRRAATTGGAGGPLVGARACKNQGAGPPHLLVQQPHRVVLAVIGAERVRADELRQRAGLVG